MLCSKCGVETHSSKIICEACAKEKSSSRIDTWNADGKSKVAENIIREQQELKKKLEKIECAHFALRALAFLVDFSILFLVLRLISISMISISGGMLEISIREALPGILGLDSGNAFGFLSAYFVNQLATIFIVLGLVFLIGILYHAILESSVLQATPGKLLFGIAVGVIDKEHKSSVVAPKLRQALLRHLVKGFAYFPFFAAFFSYVSSASESFRDVVFPTCVLLSIALLIFNYLLVFMTPKKQALQDIISQTIVFNKRNLEVDKILQFAILAVVIFFLTQYLLYSQSIWAGRQIEHREVSLPPGVSAAVANDVPVEFKASFVIYHEENNRIQIGFYREELTEADRGKIISTKSLSAVENKKPDLVSSINLRKASSEGCSYGGVRGVSHAFYKEQGLFDFPGKLTFQSFPRFVSRTPSPELSNFSCELEEGSRFTATMSGSAKVTHEDKEIVFSWSLIVDNQIRVFSSADEKIISYNSEKSPSTLAIFIPEDRQVQIGFFSSQLTFEESAYIVSTRSIFGLTKKQPDVVLKLKILKDSSLIATDSISSSEIIFTRRVGTVNFPGKEEKVYFKREGNFDALSEVASFSGLLQDNERLRGSFEGSSVAKIEDQEYYFDWNLVVDTTLYLVEEIIDPNKLEKEMFPEIAEGSLGYLRINSKQFDFAKVVSSYDEKNDMLKIALSLAEPVKQGEKGAGKKTEAEGSETQAQAQLFFEFDKGKKKFIPENVSRLTISFYREKFGEFFFPGDSDVRNIMLSKEDLLKDKEFELSGTIQLGNMLTIKMKGLNEVPKSNLAWKLNIETLVGQ